MDLLRALRARGVGLAAAVRLLDAGAPLRLAVQCGRSAWTTGNRNTFQFEVASRAASCLTLSVHPFPSHLPILLPLPAQTAAMLIRRAMLCALRRSPGIPLLY